MTIGSCFRQGWRVLSAHKKSVFYLYLVNLGTALLLLIPFMKAFESSLGSGFYRERLVARLDSGWLQLFQERAHGVAESFGPWVLGAGPFTNSLEFLLEGGFRELPAEILGVGGLYLFLHSFVVSAAVSSLTIDPEGTSFREFFRNGSEFFGRFLRLTLVAILGYWFLRQFVLPPVDQWVEELSDNARTEVFGFWLSLARYLVILLLLLLFDLVLDYARIKTALEDRTSIFLSVASASSFCVTHAASIAGLALLLLGCNLAWTGCYLGIEYLVGQGSWVGILAALFLQQSYMLGRMTLKLFYFSAQLQLVISRSGSR